MRTATKQDFKKGNVLYTKKGNYSFSITKKYSDGIWETREGKVVYEDSSNIYNINE